MAQAMIEMQFYKCGHCSKTFSTLQKLGIHHKKMHKLSHSPETTANVNLTMEVILCLDCCKKVTVNDNKMIILFCQICKEKNQKF